MRKKERSKIEKTPAGEEKKCGGRGGESITITTDSMTSSNVWLAQSLCRRGGPGKDKVQQQDGEDESKRAPRNMGCPFMGAFAHAQSMSAYMQFVPYMLPA